VNYSKIGATLFAETTKSPPVVFTVISENSITARSSAASALGRNFPRFFAILHKANRNGLMS
jgi:hypothetical protein